MRIWMVGIILLLITACSDKAPDDNALRVGIINGPESQLMQVVQNVALENYGLHIKIIEFNNYSLPNQALMEGKIDVNMFQHQPYLIAWNAVHHANLMPIAKTFIYPMGMYSYTLNNLHELKPNAVFAIPSDLTNQARALTLMQTAGLIKLDPNKEVLATVKDIISNPYHIRIKTMDASTLPAALMDVDVAIINCNYAIFAGLVPERGDMSESHYDAIYLEGPDSLYANIFVVRPNEKDDPRIHELIDAFNSPQVSMAAQTIFHNAAIRAR